MTKKQFINQNAFWQDKYYSYSIHITNGGAIYLYRIDGTIIDENSLRKMQVFRIDGIDLDLFIKNIKNSIDDIEQYNKDYKL